jgi:predicted methyltransferase
MNRRIFTALKPGGAYVVVDRSAREHGGLGDARTLRRIDEELVRREIEEAGFALEEETSLLRDDDDTRDWRGSDVATNAEGRVGDLFVLRFVRPRA